MDKILEKLREAHRLSLETLAVWHEGTLEEELPPLGLSEAEGDLVNQVDFYLAGAEMELKALIEALEKKSKV